MSFRRFQLLTALLLAAGMMILFLVESFTDLDVDSTTFLYAGASITAVWSLAYLLFLREK